MSGSNPTSDESIVPSGGFNREGSFTTSGQIDWINLVRTSYGFSVGILSRISAARVDPYTVVVGQKLGNLYLLTSSGRKNIFDVISRL